MDIATISQSARKLRLSGMTQSLEVRLQEAQANQLSHIEFLGLLLSDEIQVRNSRAIERRRKRAKFREIRSLEDFDFSFNASIKRSQIYELGTSHYIRAARDVLFTGPPGVGKSHLAQALGNQAIRDGYNVIYTSIFDMVRDLREEAELPGEKSRLTKYLKCDLLIIDDMGIKPLPGVSGEYFFEIIMRRYELRSTIMTSNRPLEEWGKLIGDVPSATAILDRFLHNAELVQITGRSYRLRHNQEQSKDDQGRCSAPQINEGGILVEPEQAQASKKSTTKPVEKVEKLD